MDKNKLIDAYLDLMGHFYEAMDDTLHSTADALERAKTKLGEMGDLTHEDLDKVAAFLKRDIDHAATRMAELTDLRTYSDWFKFDIDLLENFALDAFASLADKTRVELARLGQLASHQVYQAGEIASPGTFVCEACGKEIAFKATSQIPECPVCHAQTFIRA